jgi:sorting nexin-1/2
MSAALQFVLRTAASLVFLHDYWVLVPEAVAALEEREDAYEGLLLMREELQERQAAAAAAAATRDKRMAALYTSAEALQVRGD